jgi:phenylacetate-CoA ligase
MSLSLAVRSELPGLDFPALQSGAAAQLHSVFLQLEHSQWLPASMMVQLQVRQLEQLLSHVWATVPWYHGRLHAAGMKPGRAFDPGAWQTLQLLTRRDLQVHGAALQSNRLPIEHGRSFSKRTSGSTGEPIEVLRSGLDQLMWQAITLRDHAWHERDLSGALCSIRQGVERTPEGTWLPSWGPPASILFDTGKAAAMPAMTDVAEQVSWLVQRDPDYLLIYPTVLAALLRQLQQQRLRLPSLRQVRTVAEVLSDATRELCREVLGVPVVDIYSASELGNIALQCPHSGLYHVQSESLFVEILDQDGIPCLPGEVGRVVVTTLHGFAMPLLRYELRDYAEVAADCPCGRGLPSLRRIMGRTRNLMRTPLGVALWPLGRLNDYHWAPVRQYQVAQLGLDHIEFRMVTDRPLTIGEEADLAARLRKDLCDFRRIDFCYVPEFAPAANGKFEEFVSLLPD